MLYVSFLDVFCGKEAGLMDQDIWCVNWCLFDFSAIGKGWFLQNFFVNSNFSFSHCRGTNTIPANTTSPCDSYFNPTSSASGSSWGTGSSCCPLVHSDCSSCKRKIRALCLWLASCLWEARFRWFFGKSLASAWSFAFCFPEHTLYQAPMTVAVLLILWVWSLTFFLFYVKRIF